MTGSRATRLAAIESKSGLTIYRKERWSSCRSSGRGSNVHLAPAQINSSQTEVAPLHQPFAATADDGQFRDMLCPQAAPEGVSPEPSAVKVTVLPQTVRGYAGAERLGGLTTAGPANAFLSRGTVPDTAISWRSGDVPSPQSLAIAASNSVSVGFESAEGLPSLRSGRGESDTGKFAATEIVAREPHASTPVTILPAAVPRSRTNAPAGTIQPAKTEGLPAASPLPTTTSDASIAAAIDAESSPPPMFLPGRGAGCLTKSMDSPAQWSSPLSGLSASSKSLAPSAEQSVSRSPSIEPVEASGDHAARARALRREKNLPIPAHPAQGNLPSSAIMAPAKPEVASTAVSKPADSAPPAASSDLSVLQLAPGETVGRHQIGLTWPTAPASIGESSPQPIASTAGGATPTSIAQPPGAPGAAASADKEENAQSPPRARSTAASNEVQLGGADAAKALSGFTVSAANPVAHIAAGPPPMSTATLPGLATSPAPLHAGSGTADARTTAPATHSGPMQAGATFERMDSAAAPRVIESAPQRLAVGVRSPGLGWVEIRTSNAAGQVSATLATGSVESHAAVTAQLPSMREYLAGEHIRIDQLASERFSPSSGGHGGSSGEQAQSSGSRATGTPESAISSGPTSADAELENLTYINVRV